MSERARNVRVGVFVFAGMLAIGSCAVILGGQNLFAQKIRMESYFDEAVTGLVVGSPVRYRGVKIGEVISIGFVQDYYDLSEEEHDGSRLDAALEKAFEFGDRIPLGIFYEVNRRTYEETEKALSEAPLVHQKLGMANEVGRSLLEEYI